MEAGQEKKTGVLNEPRTTLLYPSLIDNTLIVCVCFVYYYWQPTLLVHQEHLRMDLSRSEAVESRLI